MKYFTQIFAQKVWRPPQKRPFTFVRSLVIRWGVLSRQAIRYKHTQKPLSGLVVVFAVVQAVFVRAFRCYPWRGG